MAGVKISALPALSVPQLTDLYPTVQDGVTYKVSLSQIVDTTTTQQSCRLATDAALTAVYDNGVDGVGATLTNAGALAALSIDGVAVVAGDRILVKDQASTFQNGIYIVTDIGSGATAWVLTRSSDYDEPADIDGGDLFTVGFGTVNALTQWIQTAVVTTIGTDPITFESNIVAGTGLTKTNNTIALDVPVSMANGGTNKIMVASAGSVVYSDANSLELSAPGNAGQIFQSAGAGAPVWTTSTFPSTGGTAGTVLRSDGTNWVNSTSTFADTYAINTILYNGTANTVTGLATANSAILYTNSTGVPAWSASLTNGQLMIGSTGASPTPATLTAGTGITIDNAAGGITINATGGGLGTATIAGTTQNAAVNIQYIALNAGQTTLSLPSTFAVGSIISLIGSTANVGGWIIDAPAGDTIRVLNSTTSAGGTVTSTAQAGECIELICDVADTSWVATKFVSTLLTTA